VWSQTHAANVQKCAVSQKEAPLAPEVRLRRVAAPAFGVTTSAGQRRVIHHFIPGMRHARNNAKENKENRCNPVISSEFIESPDFQEQQLAIKINDARALDAVHIHSCPGEKKSGVYE